MLGVSHESATAATEHLAQSVAPANMARVAEELLSAGNVLGQASSLSHVLADSGTEEQRRQDLAASVFGSKLSEDAMAVVSDVVSRRWRRGADLADTVESLGAEAAFIAAESDGTLDAVEDELFRVDRLISGDDELRKTVTDPAVDDEAKARLLLSLFDGKIRDTTALLVRHFVTHARGRRLNETLPALVQQSAKRRNRVLATARVAAAITAAQTERLKAALSRIYRREIDLHIEIDPNIQGGVVVGVGDEVIDGSIAYRIDQIRKKVGA